MRKSVLVCDKCGVQVDNTTEYTSNWYSVSMEITSEDNDEDKSESIRHHLCGECADVAVIPFRDLCKPAPESREVPTEVSK